VSADPDPKDSEPVIKLPRGRGIRLSGPELFRIALTLALLVALLLMTQPCSRAVSTFVMGMDGSAKGSAETKAVKPTAPADSYEHLKPGMSEAEIRSAIERAKTKGSAGAPIHSGLE
jgi:hypothetical protein